MLRRLTVLLLVAALLAGCGDDGEDDAGPTATTRPPAVSVITPLQVELISPGAAPRAVLEEMTAVGQSWAGELRFDLEAGGTQASVVGTTTLETTAVDDEGTANARYALEDLDITVAGQPPEVDALTIAGDLVVRPDRTVTTATVRAEQAVGSIGAATIEQALDPRLPFIFFPFPTEAIGGGATWRISGSILLLGSFVDLDAEARLVRRAGGAFEVETAFSLRQPDRAGVVLDGLGRIEGDTAQLGPVAGSLALAGTLVVNERPEPAALDLRIRQQ